MPNSAARCNALLFDLLPFTSNHFSILHVWLEVPEHVEQLSFRCLTSEVVDTVQDGVTHPGQLLFKRSFATSGCLLLLCGHSCASTQVKGVEVLVLGVNVTPVLELDVKVKHLVCNETVFKLATVYDH